MKSINQSICYQFYPILYPNYIYTYKYISIKQILALSYTKFNQSSNIIHLTQLSLTHNLTAMQYKKQYLVQRTNTYQCPISNFKKHTLHGKGNFGQVFMAQNKNTKQIVAIKKIKKISNVDQGLSVNFIREVSILKKLHHPNITRLLNYCVNQTEYDGFIVLEYMPTDLQKQLLKGSLFLSQTKSIIKSILLALSYCHKNSIMHRDMKPSNILLHPQKNQCKLADFGIAKQYHQNPKPNTTKIAALYYRAPQLLLQNQHYGYEIDIWGVGCIFAQCILGKIIIKGQFANQMSQLCAILDILGISCKNIDIDQIKKNVDKIRQQPIQNKLKQLRSVLSLDGLDLLNKMLCFDAKKRITARQALQHSFFNDISQFNSQNNIDIQTQYSMLPQI